jgi:membrane fusion protein, heavy metal efflux system
VKLKIKHPVYAALTLAFALLTIAGIASHASDDHHHGEKAHSEEPVKGPHRGRLLQDGDFAVELAIFERGVPPEYRAWATDDRKAIAPKDWQLQVELTRLGGQKDLFSFAPQEDFLRGKGEVSEPHSFDVVVTARYQNRQHQWKFPSYEGRVKLSAALAQQAGITTAIAEAGKLQEQLIAHGQLEPKPELVRQLKARYPGVVRSVQVSLGDQVKAGQTLATVEANESLRSYAITAPISGVLIAQSAREGELTGEQPLFTLADYRQLSLRLPAFPQTAAKLATSQSVSVKVGDGSVTSSIKAIVPASDSSPARLALADIPNPDGKLHQGSWVEATVNLAETQVPLRVDNRALQGFRDWQVVFIQVGDTYEIRPLELGRRDKQFTEVLGGLNAGDRYVVENSYLLKADLEKSGASHDH